MRDTSTFYDHLKDEHLEELSRQTGGSLRYLEGARSPEETTTLNKKWKLYLPHQFEERFLRGSRMRYDLNRLARKENFENLKKRTIKPYEDLKKDLTAGEIKAINEFHEKEKFNSDLITTKGEFHEEIENYPAILWILKKTQSRKG